MRLILYSSTKPPIILFYVCRGGEYKCFSPFCKGITGELLKSTSIYFVTKYLPEKLIKVDQVNWSFAACQSWLVDAPCKVYQSNKFHSLLVTKKSQAQVKGLLKFDASCTELNKHMLLKYTQRHARGTIMCGQYLAMESDPNKRSSLSYILH